VEDVAAGVGAAAAAAAPDTEGVLVTVEGNQVFLLFV